MNATYPSPIGDLLSVGSERRSIRELLSSEDRYFDLLFHSLELHESIEQEVWQLLMRLPTNPDLKTRILSLHDTDDVVGAKAAPNWNKLFDASSLYKLMYSLQIIQVGSLPSLAKPFLLLNHRRIASTTPITRSTSTSTSPLTRPPPRTPAVRR